MILSHFSLKFKTIRHTLSLFLSFLPDKILFYELRIIIDEPKNYILLHKV